MVGCLLVADSSGEGEKECQHLEGFHQGTASHSIKLDQNQNHHDFNENFKGDDDDDDDDDVVVDASLW